MPVDGCGPAIQSLARSRTPRVGAASSKLRLRCPCARNADAGCDPQARRVRSDVPLSPQGRGREAMTYGRAHLQDCPSNLDGAAASHLAELVRGDSLANRRRPPHPAPLAEGGPPARRATFSPWGEGSAAAIRTNRHPFLTPAAAAPGAGPARQRCARRAWARACGSSAARRRTSGAGPSDPDRCPAPAAPSPAPLSGHAPSCA